MHCLRDESVRMEEVRYELLRPSQVVARRNACPLAYLPLGGIEWHGPQNPLGLDGLKARELCVRAARQGGGLVFPVPWYGELRDLFLAEANLPVRTGVAREMQVPVENFDRGHVGGKTVTEQVLFYQQLLFHIYHQIRSLGFEAIYVLVGHGPLKPYAVLSAEVFERDTGVRMAASYAAELVPGYREDHAALFETGVMMALRPDLVDLGELPEGDPEQLVGIGGRDPRDGAQEFGEAFVPACVTRLAERGRELLSRPASTGAMHVE